MVSRLAFLAFAAAVLACAQSANTADLIGTVRDASGAGVPQARITVTNQDTGGARTTSTQDTGFYRLPSLAAGAYRVRATRQGFADAVRCDVVLHIERPSPDRRRAARP